MLNRPNLTLSALALSNRLNLGTRSLAVNASVNHGAQPSRIRHTHQDVMREGMVWYGVFPIIPKRYAMPTIPGSSSRVQQRLRGCLTLQPFWSAVDSGVEPEPRPDNLVGRPEIRAEDWDSWIQIEGPDQCRPTKRGSITKPRGDLKSARNFGPRRAARRAAEHRAAASAATAGK